MKIKHYFGLAVIAAMTASCSSNEDLGTAGPGTGTNEAGVGYATFSINLPTTSGTRADANPEFKPGDANEYKVNDATLLIFKKDATGKHLFKGYADLGNMEPWTSSSTEGITTTAKLTAKITNAEVGSNKGYYALIVLNNNSGTNQKITYPDIDKTYYEDWSKDDKKANATNYLKHDNGFFMANAPKYVAGAPETLVEIKNIYPSKQQAENSTATTVYVERGLAKVSLTDGSENKHVKIAEGNYKDDQVDITGWTLDVTNTKTFPIHVTDGLWEDIWKTAATTAATNGATMDRFRDTNTKTEFPRVYWGLDPNYSNEFTFTSVPACNVEFKMATTADFKKDEDAKKAQYCLENTFDIDHMVQGQTTRVLFSAKYTPASLGDGETFYKMGNSSQLWNADNVVAQIKAKAMEVFDETDPDKVEVILTGTDLAKAGTHLITKANVKHGTAEIEDADITAINTKLGFKEAKGTDPMVGLSTYVDGVSYYIARVKHFGDALTPWNPGNQTYDSNNANWLGRYGVLRNNWYELTVKSVSGPGYPDIPKVNPTDPDDVNDQYINVEVKILDWAKRSQEVEL
jgi:hypothetical protein